MTIENREVFRLEALPYYFLTGKLMPADVIPLSQRHFEEPHTERLLTQRPISAATWALSKAIESRVYRVNGAVQSYSKHFEGLRAAAASTLGRGALIATCSGIK